MAREKECALYSKQLIGREHKNKSLYRTFGFWLHQAQNIQLYAAGPPIHVGGLKKCLLINEHTPPDYL
jgi:hypothetical protein